MAWVRDIDSLYNLIGFVVVYAPDRFPKREYLPTDQGAALDHVFAELHAGMQFIEPKAADAEKRERLTSLLDQSLASYRVGDDVKGSRLLQEFQDLIFKTAA